jgi:hypothetical protein
MVINSNILIKNYYKRNGNLIVVRWGLGDVSSDESDLF